MLINRGTWLSQSRSNRFLTPVTLVVKICQQRFGTQFFCYANFAVREVSPSLESFWARQSVLLALLVVVLVAALGFVLDITLLTEGVPRRDLLLLGNLITGVIVGWAFFRFLRNEKNKSKVIRERIITIAELNHHIRNALQVIRYAGGSKTTLDATQLQLINEAVAKIEWALQEVLPRYPQGGDLKDGQGAPEFSSAVVHDFVLRRKETRPH